jgi:Mrp family chromosome partitioning ATPase
LGQARRELNIIASLQAHWFAICVIFVVAAACLGKLAWDRQAVTYTSSAALHVAKNFQRTLQGDRELDLGTDYDYDSFRNDQVALILRPDVLLDALSRCGQLGPPWAESNAATSLIVESFSRAIGVTSVPKSSRIVISVVSTHPEVPQPALSALLAAFKDAHRREYFFTEDARPETLRTALAEVETNIAKKRKEIEDLTKQLQVTSFSATTDNPWTTPLDQARIALATLKREVGRLHGQRETVRTAVAKHYTADELLAGSADWGDASVSFDALLTPLAARHAELTAELFGMSEGHPGLPAIRAQLALLEDRAVQIRQRYVDQQLRDADSAVLEAESAAALLQEEVRVLEQGSAVFLASFQRGRILEDELPRDLSLRDRLNQRLEFFEFEAQSPSYAQISQDASEVDLRGESNLKRNLAIAVFLAMMLALGLPILWDLRDKQIHTPGDVNRALGFNLAGWLPRAGRFVSSPLQAGQYQRVAQAIDREGKRHGVHLIVFTGVKGRSVLALLQTLASSLHGLGRKVLVVDATGSAASEEPEAGPGLLGLLRGERLKTAPLPEGGDFLPWGRIDQGIARWDSWSQILVAAADDYDFVLVAGPALLTSPASEVLVTEADLAILVVEAERENLGEVNRAGQMLQSLKPKAVGALLSNVRAFRSRGYYRGLAST